MESQNYENHQRYVPLFHFVLSGLLLLTLIGSCVNLYKAIKGGHAIYDASLIVVLAICGLLFFWYCRIFPLVAQDRAIRAEENLRHYVLTGSLLDPRITMRQVIGLRFASDEEFPDLAKKAAEEGLSENAIKKAIKNWKADNYRV